MGYLTNSTASFCPDEFIHSPYILPITGIPGMAIKLIFSVKRTFPFSIEALTESKRLPVVLISLLQPCGVLCSCLGFSIQIYKLN